MTETAIETVLIATTDSKILNQSFYENPFTKNEIILSATIIFTFMLIGIIGNTLTIAVIAYYKELNENVFMRFILSLCVSDLLSALISWLFLYRRTWGFNVWSPLPDVLCTFYWATDIMTSYVTALHILSLTIYRFLAMKFPLICRQLNMLRINIWITSIWIICFLGGFLPCCFIFGATTKDATFRLQHNFADARWPACTAREHAVHSQKLYLLYQKIGYAIFLYAPIIGVVIMSFANIVAVVMKLKTIPTSFEMKKRQRTQKRAVYQLLLIILSFLIGYIPFTVYEFWSVQVNLITSYYQRLDYWFGTAEYFFLRFSECLNPIFYNLGSKKVRHYTKKFVKNKLTCFCTKRKR